MIGKKTAALTIALGALIGIKLNQIYVPDTFEKPIQYKALTSLFASFDWIVRFFLLYLFKNIPYLHLFYQFLGSYGS